jgi:sugar/nucleoside kinase (ribokinase family)
MPVDDGETLEMIKHAPALAPQAYHALIPHPTLVAHERFPEVAAPYDYVQMNAAEARALAPTDDINELALCLRRGLGEGKEFAITNGSRPGLLWADGAWWLITPPAVEVVSDVGSGDLFCTAWVIARGLRRAGAQPALTYALSATAAAIGGGRVRPFQP